ncbi:MAG TPA: hypothetical protein VF461_11165 [Gemmatimonadaceae bacterium]
MQTQKDQEARVPLQNKADEPLPPPPLQPQLDAIAPDTDRISINFSCENNVVSVGLSDTQPDGKPAWAVRRHPNNWITWTVAHNVTINSIAAKSGCEALPIDPDPNERGGKPGVPFRAKVKHNAGHHGSPSTKIYTYFIDVTCKPKTGPAIRLVIDPEFIVNKP